MLLLALLQLLSYALNFWALHVPISPAGHKVPRWPRASARTHCQALARCPSFPAAPAAKCDVLCSTYLTQRRPPFFCCCSTSSGPKRPETRGPRGQTGTSRASRPAANTQLTQHGYRTKASSMTSMAQ